MANARRDAFAAQLNRTQLASTSRGVHDTRSFERTMAARREAASVQDALHSFHAVNARVTAINESESRVENMRRARRVQQQNAELAQAYALERSVAEKEQRRMLAEQDAQLAAAMSHLHSEQVAREQNERRICDSSEELSELRAMLAAAQLNKARATQREEAALKAAIERDTNARMDREMEADRIAALELEAAELAKRQLINMQGREVLQAQMAEKERARQLAYEQFLREKAQVDSIVASIEADDAAKLRMQLAKQRELQDNIRVYLEERARWRAEEKARAEHELRKIQEYQELQQRRHDELMRQKAAKVERQDAVLERLTAEIEAKRREEEEMQRLLFELYQEEAESKALAEIRAREEKINAMRREMIEANEYQKAFKAQKRLNAAREEEAFRDKMMAKFAEDKRLEQMNVERRRREMAEYKNEVESILQERKRQYEAAVEAELEQRAAEQREMEYKLSVIERERERLLREYARDLREYLPKGVFRSESDYEKVFDHKPNQPKKDEFKISPPSADELRQQSRINAQNNRASNIRF